MRANQRVGTANSDRQAAAQARVKALAESPLYKIFFEIFLISVGSLLMVLSARFAFRIPGTLVPVTGQTFMIVLWSMMTGQKRALATVGTYMALGFSGLPFFALAASGALVGPTLGYLVGMFIASGLIGFLADRGWNQTFFKALAIGVIGHIVIYAFGMVGLSYFISAKNLLAYGVLPFLVPDLFKVVLAASVVTGGRKVLGLDR